VLFGIFSASERISRRRGLAHPELDEFHVVPGEEISPQTVGVRPGNVVVMVRDYNTLYNLASVLDRINIEKQDVVVLHIRVLMRAGSGEHGLSPEQLFTTTEQELFSRALKLAEKNGKTVRLALVAANEIWDGILRAAQALHSSTVVLGLSPKIPAAEEARRAGESWERLPEPRPQLILEIYAPTGHEEIFYLGPHAPRLTPNEIDLLHSIWLRFSSEVGCELHHHDIVHFALNELERELADGKQAEVVARLRQHLEQIKDRREPNP
jgi:hypothetical protein